jgi:hypothetical protein
MFHLNYYTLLSDMYRNVCWYVKCPIFVLISTHFGYAEQLIVNIYEMRSVEAALIHADNQADRQTNRQTQEDQRTDRHRWTDGGTD